MTLHLDAPRTSDEARDLRVDLVERAARLQPLLSADAERVDRERAVPTETVDALADAGLLSLMQPTRLGGLQADFRTLLEVSRELGRGCGSTAWVATLLNANAWFVGLFPAQAQEEVWAATPTARVAGVLTPSGTARAVEGGYLVSGRWAPASGCTHADWAVLGVQRSDATGPDDAHGLVIVPMAELAIEDTWRVVGMRGTASNTLHGTDLFVPAHRYHNGPDAFAGRYATPFTDEALYRAPLVPVTSIVLTGPLLGLATAAVDILVDKAPQRSLTLTDYARQADAPSVQIAAGRAASLADTAVLHAYRTATDIDESSRSGIAFDRAARARMRMDAGVATVNAREAIELVCSAQGASTFGEANPLQRVWRDAETASRHAVLNPEVAVEIYGRSMLGVEGPMLDLL